MVRLKVIDEAIIYIANILFQFLMVRLKEDSGYDVIIYATFQFLMVRLKVTLKKIKPYNH